MRVSFDLSPTDIRYFRDRLSKVRKTATARKEDLVIRGAAKLVQNAKKAKPPEFIAERIEKLGLLIEMLKDREWRLEGKDRERILQALAYFVDPDDLIPDSVPVVGFLDDAIMIELVVTELVHEIQAYRDFCDFRERQSTLEREDVELNLAARRRSLQSRMRRRRRNDRQQRSQSRTRARASRPALRLW